MARRTAQQRRIEQLLRAQTASIRKAFTEAMASAKLDVDQAALVRFLEAGDIERAVQLFRIERGVLFPLEQAIRDAFIGGGLAVAKELPKGLSGVFGFNGSHPLAVALAEQQAAQLVTNVSDDAISNARKIIVDGLAGNRSLDAVARDLVGRKVGRRRVGGVIGLTEPQTDRMINLRSMLSDPDRINEYFKDAAMTKPRYREASRRFEAEVRKAITGGKALPAGRVDALTEAYKVKASGLRGKRVAKDEAIMAQSSGRDEGYRQVVESGKVESATVRWQKSPRMNDREDHQQMDGITIQVGEKFTLPDGVQMAHPRDPAGGVEHNANCGCVGIYRVKLPKG